MKNIFFLLLLFFLCECLFAQNPADTAFTFQFNAKSYIEMQCENCAGEYGIEFRSSTTYGRVNFDLKKVKNGVYFAEVPVDFPQQVRLVTKSPIRSYINMLTLMPNDTLKIAVEYNQVSQKHLFVKVISAKYPELTQYSVDKVKDLKYYETDFALFAVENDKREAFLQAEIAYLEEYHKKKPLPHWFVNLEKNNSMYYFENSWNSYRPVENRHALNSGYYMLNLDEFIKAKIILADSTYIEKKQEPSYKKRIAYAKANFASEISDFYTLYLVIQITSYPPEKEKLLAIFDIPSIKNDAIREYAEYKMQKCIENISYIAEAKPLPEMLVLDEKNELVVLNTHFDQKLIYLNFWFPGCAPCIKSTPAKNKLVENMPTDGFELINVCVSGTEEDWKKAIEKHQIKGRHFYVKHSEVDMLMKDLFGISAYPHYAIIQNGKMVVKRAENPDVVQNYLEMLMKK